MDHLRTEEEQVAALKKWWSENGNSLLIGIGLALAVIFGWKAWQQNAKDQKEQASILFFELNQAATAAQTATEEDAQQKADDIAYLAQDLQEKFPDSEYATFARLYQAKQYVNAGEFAAAEEAINSIEVDSENAPLQNIINLRLARVKAAQDKYEEALSLLSVNADDSFYGHFQELKGDILKMKGDREKAKEAYKVALSKAEELSQPTQLLKIKIDDLADV